MQLKPQYQEPDYTHPFLGWHTQLPRYIVPKEYSTGHKNFIIRNGEIITAPKITFPIPFPENETSPIRGLTTFIDSNGLVHTVAITKNGIWQLIYIASQQKWQWNLVFNFNGANSQYAFQTFLNKIYWTNGGVPGVFYWDGIQNTLGEVTGPSPTAPKYGSYFMGELGFHLILLSTIEVEAGGNITYPQRIRWAPSGIVNVWDPATNPGAGFNDMLDVPDSISGFMTVGRSGYVFRVNGITQMTLTGVGSKPFDFDHLWASDRGIGNAYPQTIASYGPIGFFVSSEDIYLLTASSFNVIGGGARDRIFKDLADATKASYGVVIPYLHRKFIYPVYILSIPFDDYCVYWIYHVEDKTWVRRESSRLYPTTKMRNCTII